MRKIVFSSGLALGLLTPLLASAVGLQVIIDGKVITLVDVSQSAWFTPYVSQAVELGIVSGYRDVYGQPTGKFGPSNNITIAEALKMASEASGYNEDAYASTIASNVNHWASAYVSVANAENFMVMDESPRLDRQATRAEVTALIASAFSVEVQNTFTGTTYSDVDVNTKYATSIEQLTIDNVVSGDTGANGASLGTFRPGDLINRAEVAKMIITARSAYGTPGTGKTPPQSI